MSDVGDPRRARELGEALRAHQLTALGTLPPEPVWATKDTRALVLVGPRLGAICWHHVTAQPEWHDGRPDPLDRWSKRVLGTLAMQFSGQAFFPSDGPPYPPFFRWALETGQMWQSPVGMLVHVDQGLWTSFRGALAVPFEMPQPIAHNPCNSCADQPCRRACPVGALSPTAYDTKACHGYLNTTNGAPCLNSGCAARRACPIPPAHARLPEHAAYHMRQFHK